MIRCLTTCALILFVSINLAAQVECDAYLDSTKSGRKKFKQSSYLLDFPIPNSEITVAVGFSNQAKERTLEMSLAFIDKAWFEVLLGDVLTIQFEDGSEFSFLASKKKSRASVVYFILQKPTRARHSNYPSYEDIPLCKKLHEEHITSLRLIANSKKVEIQIPKTRAEIIKIIINCLGDC